MQQEERHETYESRRSPERDEPRERSPERRDTGPERREEDDADGTNLYVANLHFDTRDEDMRRLFEPFGPIMNSSIVVDPLTRQSRGFGFVRFEKADDAHRAIDQLSGQEFEGRTIRVEKARRNRPHPKTPGQYLGPASASAKYGSRRPPSWAQDRYDDRRDRYDDRRDRYDRYDRRDRYDRYDRDDDRRRDSRDRDYDRRRDSRSRDRDRRRDSRDRDRRRDSRDRDRRRDDYDRHDRR